MLDTARLPTEDGERAAAHGAAARSRSLPAGRAREALLVAALLALSLWLYRPWEGGPFSVLDFSEFLPILRQGDGLVDGTAGLTAYYHSHGRANLLTYLWIALNWSLFGDWSPGWSLLRWAAMAANVGLGYLLLRRLGSSAAGAFAGAALLVVSTPAVGNWIRLTGEPLAAAALMGATLLGLRFGTSERPRLHAALIALLLGLAVSAKEVLVVCVPVVLLVAWCWRPGRGLGRPAPTRRNLWLAALSAAAIAVVSVPVVLALGGMTEQGYAQSYRLGTHTARNLLPHLQAMALPVSFAHPDVVLLASALVGTGLLAGALTVARLPRPRAGWLAGAALAALLPVLGTLVYLPWPNMARFYGFPFIFGVSVLLASSLTVAMRHGGGAGRLAAVPVALGLLMAVPEAHREVRTDAAARTINYELAKGIGALRGVDSVFFALPPEHLPTVDWYGRGPALRRYALAVGVATPAAPPARDISCAEAVGKMVAARGRTAFVSYVEMCGSFRTPDRVARGEIVHWHTFMMAPVRRVGRADLWIPRGPMATTPAAP